MSLEPTYQMATNPPQPLAWDEYESRVLLEWAQVLNAPNVQEAAIQAFLERHPSMVPGAFLTACAGKSGHCPQPVALISQPPLSGLTKRIPDFMWIAVDSSTISPVLIEIEQPSKRWFTQDGTPAAEFTQAQHQLAEWRAWMSEPANQAVFRDFYRLSDEYWRRLDFRPLYILILGRRREFDGRDTLNKIRRKLERDDEFYMTFDRLAPDYNCREFLCARINSPGEYSAITWPPTGTLSPAFARDRRKIADIKTAIEAAGWVTAERRDFLLARLDYWNAWAATTGVRAGIISGERE